MITIPWYFMPAPPKVRQIVTNRGRVLNVVSRGADIREAIERCIEKPAKYILTKCITVDIGRKALLREK